jgi:hypothetical protein
MNSLDMVAHCSAFTQINRRPEFWRPEWDPCELVFVRERSAVPDGAGLAAAAGSPGAGSTVHMLKVMEMGLNTARIFTIFRYKPLFLPESSVPQWVV